MIHDRELDRLTMRLARVHMWIDLIGEVVSDEAVLEIGIVTYLSDPFTISSDILPESNYFKTPMSIRLMSTQRVVSGYTWPG